MNYKDLDKNKTYCKISKSSEDIADKCIEPFFTPYYTNRLKETQHGISFVEISKVLSAISYGDTLTIFNMNDSVYNQLLEDCEVIYVGGGLGEYKTNSLLVGQQYSLNDEWTNMYLIITAAPSELRFALERLDDSWFGIRSHYQKLGFDKGLSVWNKVEAIYKELAKNYQKEKVIVAIQSLIREKIKDVPCPEPVGHLEKSEKTTEEERNPWD